MLSNSIRHQHPRKQTMVRFGLGIGILAIALIILVPQAATIQQSLVTLQDAYLPLLLLGVLCCAASYVAAALVYTAIATKRLRFWPTLLVQLAGGFTNRLGPAGTGALATNSRYLIQQRHDKITAASLTLLNNLLGFMGTVAIWGYIIAFSEEISLSSIRWESLFTKAHWVVALCVVALAAMLVVAFHRKLASYLLGLWQRLSKIVLRPGHLALGLMYSMLITVSYAACLYFIGLSFNIHISLVQTFTVLTAGIAAATITPSPGGLGGAEAGLAATLIAVGVTTHQALALALAYRFVTYWLPIIPGIVSLRVAERRHYI